MDNVTALTHSRFVFVAYLQIAGILRQLNAFILLAGYTLL